MFGFHDPFAVAAVVVGLVALVIVFSIVVVAFRKAICSLLNFLFARPVYLLHLKINDVQEWERHRHGQMYIAVYEQSLREVEKWIKAQEPELEVTA